MCNLAFQRRNLAAVLKMALAVNDDVHRTLFDFPNGPVCLCGQVSKVGGFICHYDIKVEVAVFVE